MLGKLGEMISQMGELGDWEMLQADIANSLENIFEKKGWTNSRDDFFRGLLTEAISHPPGAMRQRLESISGLLQQRYHISDEDRLGVEGDIFREIMFFFSGNMREISGQMNELVEMNRRGELLNAEVIAKLAQRAVKIRPARQQRVKAIMESIRRRVPEGYRDTFEQDYKHIFETRLPEVHSMEDQWARGQWSPADWGLDKHPLYADNPARLKLPGVKPAEPSSWAKYVEAFIQKFELEEAQQVTAWSVLRDLEPKAMQLASAAEIDAAKAADSEPKVPAKAAKAAVEQEPSVPDPIEQLFDQFVIRLETIPTDSQRQRVASASLESEEQTPGPPVSPARRP
jgi:hypothetical protein